MLCLTYATFVVPSVNPDLYTMLLALIPRLLTKDVAMSPRFGLTSEELATEGASAGEKLCREISH